MDSSRPKVEKIDTHLEIDTKKVARPKIDMSNSAPSPQFTAPPVHLIDEDEFNQRAADTCSSLPHQVQDLKELTPVCSDFTVRQHRVPGTLKSMTTIGVGGTISRYVETFDQESFVETIQQADANHRELLVVGGGSNILACEKHFPGTVMRCRRQQMRVEDDSACGGVTVTVSAGFHWDDFVCYAIENDWMGLEALSGIPGTVGAAPVQNIGAYGQEVASTIARVNVYDRAEKRLRSLTLSELKFGYRTSLLKQSMFDAEVGGGRVWKSSPRYIVQSVQFQFRHASLSQPIGYQQLADHLGVQLGQRVPMRQVREAVLDLRRSKGMVLTPDDPDTHSLGSFFVNPILTAQQAASLPPQAPRFPVRDNSALNNIATAAPVVEGLVKTSAAWLIENAGFYKGFALNPQSGARLSTKHVLAICNQGQATAPQVVELARTIQDAVREKFGVTLKPEPVQIGLQI